MTDYLRAEKGIGSWLFTIDHKRIGIMFLIATTGALFLGGIFALLLRVELLTPDRTFIDPDTNQLAPLFHPRQDDWSEHFAWLDYRVTGRTASGRATIAALQMNTDRRILIRRAEELFKLFPPN